MAGKVLSNWSMNIQAGNKKNLFWLVSKPGPWVIKLSLKRRLNKLARLIHFRPSFIFMSKSCYHLTVAPFCAPLDQAGHAGQIGLSYKCFVSIKRASLLHQIVNYATEKSFVRLHA